MGAMTDLERARYRALMALDILAVVLLTVGLGTVAATFVAGAIGVGVGLVIAALVLMAVSALTSRVGRPSPDKEGDDR